MDYFQAISPIITKGATVEILFDIFSRRKKSNSHKRTNRASPGPQWDLGPKTCDHITLLNVMGCADCCTKLTSSLANMEKFQKKCSWKCCQQQTRYELFKENCSFVRNEISNCFEASWSGYTVIIHVLVDLNNTIQQISSFQLIVVSLSGKKQYQNAVPRRKEQAEDAT